MGEKSISCGYTDSSRARFLARLRLRQISSIPTKWLIFCPGFMRTRRSPVMDVSVQYRFHASGSSSCTSFHPSLDCTVRSSGYLQLLRLTATVVLAPPLVFLAFLDAARSISLGLYEG